MKKMFFYTATICCLILPASCLTTLQPLVTKTNIITDNRIIGNWQCDNNVIQIESMANIDVPKNLDLKHSRTDGIISNRSRDSLFLAKTYLVSFKKNGIAHHMEAELTRIGSNLYLELAPLVILDPQAPEGAGSGLEFTIDYQPTFTIGKVNFSGSNSLTIQFLDGSFIKEQINAGHMRIKHEKDDMFGSFVITASSVELQLFLEKYGNDSRLFSPKNSVTLTRKG